MLSQIDSQFSKLGNDQWLHIGSCDAANNYETVDDGAALQIRQRKHPAGKNVLRKGGGETSGWVLSDSTSTWTGKAISESSAQITRERGGFKLFFSPNLSWTPLFTEGEGGLRGEKAVAGVFVWKLGILTPPTLLYIVMMEAYFLTPIYTLPEKRRLISDRMKGPLVAALRSPLMKALDRSVGTLGLWIVSSSVTFIKYVNQSSIKP